MRARNGKTLLTPMRVADGAIEPTAPAAGSGAPRGRCARSRVNGPLGRQPAENAHAAPARAGRRRAAASAVAALVIAGGLALGPRPSAKLARPSAAATQPAATQPSATHPAADDAEQLDFARRPISYFNRFCASCHGDYGAFWGAGFAADLKGEQLRDAVRQMAAGPAFAPLGQRALDAQTAYHRSLVDGRPFLTAYAGDDGALRGEVTPGSAVVLVVNGRARPAKVKAHTWQSDVKGTALVRATKADAVTELALSEKVEGVLYSHVGK